MVMTVDDGLCHFIEQYAYLFFVQYFLALINQITHIAIHIGLHQWCHDADVAGVFEIPFDL